MDAGQLAPVMRFLTIYDLVMAALRPALFGLGVALFLVFAADWMVRTRRLSPFGPVARFCRQSIDPLLRPVERMVVRAGGLPASAPWWALVAAVVGGIVLIAGLGFIRGLIVTALTASGAGSRGLYYLVVSWTFGILELALFVRIIASWIRISEYSPWIRWSVGLTEWLLRPLRRIVPPFGMLDVTPLVGYFVLWILERVMLGLV